MEAVVQHERDIQLERPCFLVRARVRSAITIKAMATASPRPIKYQNAVEVDDRALAGVATGVDVAGIVGDGVHVGRAVGDGAMVAVGVDVAVSVGVGTRVGDAVAVSTGVRVGVAVGVELEVGDGSAVLVDVGITAVGEGGTAVGVCATARLGAPIASPVTWGSSA